MCRRALDRPARPEASHHDEVEQVAAHLLRAAERPGDVEAVTDRDPEETGRSHADDVNRIAVDDELLVADVRPPSSRCQYP
jgi:hypothetical protein